jgi:hypothetical protein
MTQFVLLWSRTANALHVEPLEKMLSHNRESYTDNERVEYVPLYVGTEAEVDAAADACRGTLAARIQRAEATA